MSVLAAREIGKAFRSYASEWQRIGRWFGLNTQVAEEHWVLRNVSFEIQPGDSIGIIGQNGAGKSTLLKIITGTLKPSEGYVQVNGRVAAILELGMGFNPELTGRQNAYHVGGLMGFGADAIEQVMPDIEGFAEIGEYFDEPVRTYSSGMQVRVAFSIATAYRPEILIVDEALSVGDAYFQHKSFDRIRSFQENGTTLLIVSHDPNAVQTLCNRAILLEEGEVVSDGSPDEVFDLYNALIAKKESSKIKTSSLPTGQTQTVSGSDEARVIDIQLINSKGVATDHVFVGETVQLKVRIEVLRTIETLVFGFGIKNRLGQVMFGTNTWHTGQIIERPEQGSQYEIAISFKANLGIGHYSLQTALVDRDTHLSSNYEWKDLAFIFSVSNIDKPVFVGMYWQEASVRIEKLNIAS